MTPAQRLLLLSGKKASVVPAIAAPGGLASPSYNFTADNYSVTSNNKYLDLGSTAMRVPHTGDWYQGLFFRQTENAAVFNTYECVISKGANLSGVAVSGIYWYELSNTAAYKPLLLIGSGGGGGKFWQAADNPAATLDPGHDYMLLWGQIGNYPFFSCVRLSDLNVMFNVVSATANSSFYAAWNDTTTFFNTFQYLGWVNGTTSYPFGGSVSDVFNIRGTFPNSGGVPDAATLQSLANGESTIPDFAAAHSGTIYYYNALSAGPGNTFSAYESGTDTTAALEGGSTTNVAPVIGDAIRRPPSIRLDPFGNGFVHGLKPGSTTGKVPFSGSYSVVSGSPGGFEARLIKASDGTVFKDWTALSGLSYGGGVFSGYLLVECGTGFYREVRMVSNHAIAYASRELNTVGINVLALSQSQLYQMFDAGDTQHSSSSLTPTVSNDNWLSLIRPVGGFVDTNNSNNFTPSNSPNGLRELRRVKFAGTCADAMIAFSKQLMTRFGCAVMIIDACIPGHEVENVTLDRTVVTQQAGGSSPKSALNVAVFTPNGSTTTFSGTLVSPLPSASDAPMLPNSVSIVCDTVTATDNGSGALSGAGVTGTINYKTRAFSLTYTGAPVTGKIPVAMWAYISDYQAGSETVKTTLNQYGAAGILSPQTAHTGLLADLLLRAKATEITAHLVYWWTAMLAFMQNSTGNETTYQTDAGIQSYVYQSMADQFDRHRTLLLAQPGCSDMVSVIAAPSRECPSSGSTPDNSGKYGYFRRFVYDYVAARAANGVYFGGDYPDLPIYTNNGPHSDPYGSHTAGNRLGIAMARALGANVDVRGPVLVSAAFVSGSSRSQIDVTFSLQDAAATTLQTADGSTTTGIHGFSVGASFATAVTSDDATNGFSAAIISATVVRLTKTSGSWSAGSSLSYMGMSGVFTGTGNKTADDASLLKLLYDDASDGGDKQVYNNGTTYTPGNPAAAVTNLTVSG